MSGMHNVSLAQMWQWTSPDSQIKPFVFLQSQINPHTYNFCKDETKKTTFRTSNIVFFHVFLDFSDANKKKYNEVGYDYKCIFNWLLSKFTDLLIITKNILNKWTVTMIFPCFCIYFIYNSEWFFHFFTFFGVKKIESEWDMCLWPVYSRSQLGFASLLHIT